MVNVTLSKSLLISQLIEAQFSFNSQALRVLARVLISLPLVKVFSFLFVIFLFHCILTFNCMLSCICMLTWNLYITVMALVGFSASAVQALTYQNGDYMGSLNKKASGAQCFIMALGLFWDIVTGLPWTPNGVGSLEPRGYCIFLPGAHYLTINSPYGADSSLNKLLLLLLN